MGILKLIFQFSESRYEHVSYKAAMQMIGDNFHNLVRFEYVTTDDVITSVKR